MGQNRFTGRKAKATDDREQTEDWRGETFNHLCFFIGVRIVGLKSGVEAVEVEQGLR